jgi:allantoin racemase
MRIALVNPNSTASMTVTIVAAGRAVAAAGTDLVGYTPADGPASIEGPYDEAFALPGLIRAARSAEREGADALVVACFDDPGLEVLRAALKVPVVGIVQAGMGAAAGIADRFAVITTTSLSLPRIRYLASVHGVAERCAVLASEVPVLDLDVGGYPRVRETAERALTSGAEAILLGCAGMAAWVAALRRDLGVPVVDGVAAAVKHAEGLVAQGLQTAKTGAYRAPRHKPFAGQFCDDAWTESEDP